MTIIDIFSGFLGAGKTTLIKKLLTGRLRNEKVVLLENEYGDVLFAAVNVGRLSGLNPDSALEHTNQKFTRRFNYMEEKAIQQGRKLREMTLDEMDVLWEEAKALEGEKAKGQRPGDD